MSDSHTLVADLPSSAAPARSRSPRSRLSRGRPPGALAGLLLVAAPFAAVQGAGEVSSLRTSERPGTPYRYTTDGTEYTWGIGRNRVLEGFTSGGREYGYALSADRVELRRDERAGEAGEDRCGVFAERVDGRAGALSPDYPGDGTGDGSCDVAAMLGSRTLNRGALDLFANGGADVANVERVDYLFDSGILAPVTPEGLERAGHVVAEKDGDDRLKIAAVLSLDVLGQPASYGRPVLVRAAGCMDPALCYGVTDERHDYAPFGGERTPAEGAGDGRGASGSVAMAFVSSERLGLEAGQRYFGFSLFADDVDTDDHDPLDPTTFPNDTGDGGIAPGDAADPHGGLAGYFIDESLHNGSGRAFLDENGNGVPDEGEAGLADIQIQLYRDTDGDGLFDPRRDEPVCNATDTDTSGLFVLPGLPDGDYFAVLRENDPELPAGLGLGEGANPLPFAISGGDVDDLHFAFSGGGSGGGDTGGGDTAGTTDGGADAGAADAGGDTAGTADGGADAGAADAGGGDTAGTSDGGNDTGAVDAGGDTAGTTDGGADAGAVDAGGDTAGTTDGGADAGTADAGGEDTAGTADGGADAGTVDAGGDTAGTTDGGTDAGTADAGGDTAGTADGGTDAGTADASGDTAGTADGGTDAGTVDAGGDTAGTADGGTDAGTVDAGGDTGTTDPGATDAGTTDGLGDPDPGASRDDSPTSAGQDFFDVLQDTPTEVDVLANDIDGSGGGLTIIRVADPPNGSAEIVDTADGGQVIRYTPGNGFFGTDAFVYEIRDGDGFERSGTATATVIRFSDINRNGENDFAECGCTDLTLETGVNGSGIGHPSFVLLGLLAGAGAWRSRRRRRGESGGSAR